MKTIRFTAFPILFGLLVLASACKKETNPAAATQSGSKIMVTGQDAGTGLKSTLNGQTTVWKVTDKVGIYSPDARTTSGGDIAIVNALFTANTAAVQSSFTGTMYWRAASTSHTFYAYYPYLSSYSGLSTVVPITLPSAQTQSAAGNSDHIGPLDILVATPVTVTSSSDINANPLSSDPVHLSYNHLFTILEFQIKGTGQLKAVKLVGTSNPIAFSGGTIDITQATPSPDGAYAISPTGTTTQAVVTLTDQATLNASTAISVYMVINPGTQTGNCTIGLSSNGTDYLTISKAAPPGGFLRGKKYVVPVDAATDLSIGDSYQGGKVFYILQPSDPGYVSGEIHGLIAATEDQSAGIEWITGGSTQSIANGHTSTDLGTGQANTNFMIAQTGYDGGAAKVCHDYSITVNSVTYNDWYLPSINELNLLYLQKAAVGVFASAYYWSSTEGSADNAWVQNFDTNSQGWASKFGAYYVRAIRAF